MNALPTPEASRSGRSRRAMLNWLFVCLTAGLCYPLVKFSGFRLKPKPRYVRISAPLPLNGVHAEREFVLLDRDGEVSAVSRRCTHLGCRVNYHDDAGLLICPCHQSSFSPRGARLSGPAERDLPSYPVETKRDERNQVTEYVVEL